MLGSQNLVPPSTDGKVHLSVSETEVAENPLFDLQKELMKYGCLL